MKENSENTETLKTSQASKDVEKQESDGAKPPQNVDVENNNHFYEEKVKEETFCGINKYSVLLYAVFFSMFTIGWINVNKCPINRLIPIYLILAGFLGALTKLLSKFDNEYCFLATVILVIVNIFWHIVGAFVVYIEYQPSYDPRNGLYCNRTTYLMAFGSFFCLAAIWLSERILKGIRRDSESTEL